MALRFAIPLLLLAGASGQVKVWEAPLVVPTYPTAGPDPTPLFYEGRTYQGAKGPIYPYPIVDKLFDARKDVTYKGLYLENEYLRICVLPELGGRIFEAVDKSNGYNFFYRQHVIKPALIGMLGAWISGGVEWNIPHHHRASSFLPVEYRLEERADGSKTIWVGEMELRHRMRWVRGLTLRPGKSYVEATLRLFNRTPLAHSFLYFANVAVHTNENYQVIFPPSVDWATQHSKVQFSSWPISHQRYGGVDFSQGVDVSWWKNHPSPTSMFAFECKEDFLAGYDHGKRAGTLHVADHGIMPGKKFFTWGTGGDGKTWDNLLSDSDGPYLELMVGGYSDNQPDYSWIQPYEVKTVKEYWYPFREIGGVKNANLEAAVNLELHGRMAKVGVGTTEPRPEARVVLLAGGKPVFDETAAIAPDKPFLKEVEAPAGVSERDLKLAVYDGARELIAYQPAVKKPAAMPPPVTPPPAPAAIKTIEELILAGQRLEQFHSPAREPDPYYLEALRRDPSDYRANTALGLLEYRRGEFAQAEGRFKKAVARVFGNYTRPRDGEAYYYLGLTERALGKEDEAADALYRATWSYGYQTAGFYALAEMACRKGDFAKALEQVNRALSTNAESTKALALKTAVLRHAGRKDEAAAVARQAMDLDGLDPRLRRERALAQGGAIDPTEDTEEYLEMAGDYGNAGLYGDAIAALEEIRSREHPMVYYFLAWFSEQAGKAEDAAKYRALAARAPADFCFPFRQEEMFALQAAIERSPKDARARYYLGNLLYDLQPQAAIGQWEQARALDPSFALVRRNLAQAYARRERDIKKAIAEMETAFSLRQQPRWLAEVDELYEAGGAPPATRLAFFRKHQQIALDRDDVLAREIRVLVQAGGYDEALKLLAGRNFHIWEGADISAHDMFVDAHLLRGHGLLKAGKAAEARKDYEAALEYPANLGVGKPYRGDRSAITYYSIGAAEEAAGHAAQARQAYRKAVAEGGAGPEVAYHVALARKKLGETQKAAAMFDKLVAEGQAMLKQGVTRDDFAKFGGRTQPHVASARAHYVTGLGYLGLGKTVEARAELEQAVKLDVNQMWAGYVLSTLP